VTGGFSETHSLTQPLPQPQLFRLARGFCWKSTPDTDFAQISPLYKAVPGPEISQSSFRLQDFKLGNQLLFYNYKGIALNIIFWDLFFLFLPTNIR